ncbi:MAG: NADH-quinone oxidoreductase subunit J [Acidobacteriota bacterium]|nr:NADH-quinone oxidoreductase subunit J [Acidobacteriota bacterium]
MEWIVFLVLSGIAVTMGACLILTMSMVRAALVLMASFVALAGLFLLLGADLLAAIQIMMNVGGMLLMILFMVMMMMDPGGEMMWEMKLKMDLPGLAALSMTAPRRKAEGGGEKAEGNAIYTCPMHPEVQQNGPGQCPKCGMALEQAAPHSDDMKMPPEQHHRMMADMAMSTRQLPWAIVIGALSSALLIALIVVTPWPVSHSVPHGDSTSAVGHLLLSKYMIGFEGAAFLILAGMAGAVILGTRERPST